MGLPPLPAKGVLDDQTPRSANASNDPNMNEPSSTNSSPSMLPYLQDSNPPSPKPDPDSPSARVPAPRIARPVPSQLSLNPNNPLASGSSASPTLSTASSSSSKFKRRPAPLMLGRQEIGQDEELTAQLRTDGRWSARSAITIVSPVYDDDDARSDISNEINDLSLLRQNVAANLNQRPLDVDSPSTPGSTETSPFGTIIPLPPLTDEDQVDIAELDSLETGGHRLIIDTRPLAAFLTSHLPKSININIPTLIFKRLKRSRGVGATAETLGSYITTAAGRAVWDGFADQAEIDVVILGSSDQDEVAQVYKGIVDRITQPSKVKLLRGGWPAVLASEAVSYLVTGDGSTVPSTSTAAQPPPFQGPIPTFNIAPPPIPDTTPHPQGLSQKQSMPSLRTGIRRTGVPSLSIQVDPRPALGPRSASAVTGKFPNLHLDIGAARRAGPSLAPKSPSRSPIRGSFQQACLEQSQYPPSPTTFSDITLPTPGSTSWAQRKSTSGQNQAHSAFPGPSRTGQARNAIAPFIVSTILPTFLFLGPEINSMEEVRELQRMGVKRILNVAIECQDDQGLGLSNEFERYHQIPMRDIVEETGVTQYIREACDFLNDARLHSAPVYVHCKAGKSRSVTVVLAYLIHANAWTLKTAYAYVAEHRNGISPNIGFVAELMQFEERELGLKQSAGVHGDVPQPEDNVADKHDPKSASTATAKKPSPRKPKYNRESLPPAWALGSASLGSKDIPRLLINDATPAEQGGPRRGSQVDIVERGKDRKVSDEREVRKDGHWVQQRRAPVDRLTLQPGRRASKAGLESLRGSGRVPDVSHDTDESADKVDKKDDDEDGKRLEPEAEVGAGAGSRGPLSAA